MYTFFAASVALDVIGLLPLAVTLRNRTFELVCFWENDRLPSASLNQAVVDGLCHGTRAGVLTLDNVLSRRFLERPQYWLWR